MIPTRIGQEYKDGFFSGYLAFKTGVVALVVSPKQLEIHGTNSRNISTDHIRNSLSLVHGVANTTALVHRRCPIIGHLVKQNLFPEWHIPSVVETLVCYTAFKPLDNFSTMTYFNVVETFYSNESRNDRHRNYNVIPSYINPNTALKTTSAHMQSGNKHQFNSDVNNRYYWTSTSAEGKTLTSVSFRNGVTFDRISPVQECSIRPVKWVPLGE